MPASFQGACFVGRLPWREKGHLVLAEALAPRHREGARGGRAVPTVGVRDHLRAGDNGRPDPYPYLPLTITADCVMQRLSSILKRKPSPPHYNYCKQASCMRVVAGVLFYRVGNLRGNLSCTPQRRFICSSRVPLGSGFTSFLWKGFEVGWLEGGQSMSLFDQYFFATTK